jgi:hypothetical protein
MGQFNTTVAKMPASYRIVHTEKCPADAPAETVKDAFLSFLNVCAAGESHGFTSFHITNGELME